MTLTDGVLVSIYL